MVFRWFFFLRSANSFWLFLFLLRAVKILMGAKIRFLLMVTIQFLILLWEPEGNLYSEGKMNTKAGDPLWPKNLSLLIFSERKFSVSSKILVSQTTSHIVYFFLAMVALFSYIVHFASRLCYNVFLENLT